MIEYVSALDKVYEYEGKIYSEEDRSIELGDRWGGDLYSLYWELKKKGLCNEYTRYTTGNDWSYESAEELLAEEFGEYEVKE